MVLVIDAQKDTVGAKVKKIISLLIGEGGGGDDKGGGGGRRGRESLKGARVGGVYSTPVGFSLSLGWSHGIGPATPGRSLSEPLFDSDEDAPACARRYFVRAHMKIVRFCECREQLSAPRILAGTTYKPLNL